MVLIINTASSDAMTIMVAKNANHFISKKTQGGKRQSEKLLTTIEALLKRHKIKLSQIKKISVVTGPGSFTGLRVGVVVANTLSYALKVPVVGIGQEEFTADEDLVIKSLAQKAGKSKVVLPEYGREANITIKGCCSGGCSCS